MRQKVNERGEYEDRVVTGADSDGEFTRGEGFQAFFKENGLTSKPK